MLIADAEHTARPGTTDMAFALYKPGQGYWVRVLTAAFAGALIMAACAWLWSQLETASTRLIPVNSYELAISPAEGQPATPGQTISLMGASADGTPVEIGTAVIKADAPTTGGGDRLTIAPPTFRGDRTIADIRSVAPPAGSTLTRTGVVVGQTRNAAFEPLYLQAGGVGVLMVLGTVLVYWLVGIKPSISEFLIATDGEMKKVNWSTRKDVIGSTWVVIIWSLLLAAGLFTVDLLFSGFFRLIGVLHGG
ncbi:MAG: preprotein translocase subunit SecE [Phycisphaerales bacterium]